MCCKIGAVSIQERLEHENGRKDENDVFIALKETKVGEETLWSASAGVTVLCPLEMLNAVAEEKL